jgi:hypothetical protein
MRRIIATAGVIAVAGLGFVGPAGAAVEVDPDLAEHLEFMVEEERLAHELYTLFASEYPSIFAGIARSEERHMEAVARQLDLRGMDDPGEGLEPGDYAVDELDELYATWSAQGLESVEAALQVGIDLEEADIADLEEALGDPSTEPVERVFSALLAGSRRHLQAFTSALEGDCADCLGEPKKMTAKREAWGRGWQGDERRGHGNGRGDGWPADPDRYQKGTPRYPAGEPTG